jgi:hypothetical protein
MITLDMPENELPEALYLAHLSATQTLMEHPHDAPPTVWWESLTEPEREVWRRAARRLLALHQTSEV